mmetsp:Transcript_23745/g.55377  ORF Transcript_23745/g.55377 Transcript_23745/m.55377 type:complete len:374 (-) Transcript_23745:103-1224(-)|eukprot:CAMPEP_0171097912 /NCGR_PEP_ID=MMETSP0766_2-20121228/47821_1 /TAXON_ID=439317 /ORGANISM="Gambierdiscus australes, Strain CAWD 149" /LENGTH=373 /DNA_ID=CAMNT_0011557185 /DNA_START=95 /DNA_END=1216 /DNA_ORIENTATION=-
MADLVRSLRPGHREQSHDKMDASLKELEEFLQAALLAVGEKRLAVEEAERQMREREAELKRGWQQLQERQEAVALHARSLEQARQDFEAEKSAMMKPGVGLNDIIGLNFGGERVVKVKRSLLLQFEESMLARMFSGRHEDSLDRDESGNVFFDYSPNIMLPLIEFLRLHRDLPPEAPDRLTPPEIAARDKTAWDAMTEFMGLKEILSSPQCAVRRPTTFSGILTEVRLSDLEGWTMFFCKPYSHPTTIVDFLPPDKALRGGSLLVGARRASEDILSVAAMGHADVVTAQRSDGSTTHHNGVHWYCLPAVSVGFAPNSNVTLNQADTQHESSAQRLSWHLTGIGGYRAGSALGLNGSSEWEKVILASSILVSVV